LHEIGFLVADGRELFRIRGEVALVFGGIVSGEQDGAAGERGFDGVQRRSGFAFAGLGTRRELCVQAIRLQARFGRLLLLQALSSSFLALRSMARRIDRAVMLAPEMEMAHSRRERGCPRRA